MYRSPSSSIPVALVLCLLLGGCASAPIVDMTKATPAERTAASNIHAYFMGQDYPSVQHAFGSVTAYSCERWAWDSPASKGNALDQLKLLAARMGANSVIDVNFDKHGTDA